MKWLLLYIVVVLFAIFAALFAGFGIVIVICAPDEDLLSLQRLYAVIATSAAIYLFAKGLNVIVAVHKILDERRWK